MFDTVLVANRGEIACRIIDTLDKLGVRSVAVFSDADADALHVRKADLAVRLGPTPPAESYLCIERVVEAARRTGAQAVHPGYGFLAENAAFARACAAAGMAFVGPPPEAVEAMGDKIAAKGLAEVAGVPVVPGVHEPDMSAADLVAAAGQVGYPLLIKAASGGGGKGMRVVTGADELPEALAAARREARGAFGDDALLLERYVSHARHVEIQVFADAHGGVVHLGERECSLQRRHQKVVEECPSPIVTPRLRAQMGDAAVKLARAVGYIGAGTVEFVVTAEREFFFLEMNTRLQVEHPVTEEVYGVDLVEWQLRVAAGERLPVSQNELRPRGHAIEARIYAEDPARGFLPTGGRVLDHCLPDLQHVRVDTGLAVGDEVASAYDPLLEKVIAWGEDRTAALRRLRYGLRFARHLGVVTNSELLRRLLAHPDVVAGNVDTRLIDREIDRLLPPPVPDAILCAAGLARLAELQHDTATGGPFDLASGWRSGERAWMTFRMHCGDRHATVRVRGRAASAEVALDGGQPEAARIRLGDELVVWFPQDRLRARYIRDGDVAWFGHDDGVWAIREVDELAAARNGEQASIGGELVAPMPGTVSVVNVTEGDAVRAGQTLIVVEAMKMEHPLVAPFDGVVDRVGVRAGDQVGMEQLLAAVTPDAQRDA